MHKQFLKKDVILGSFTAQRLVAVVCDIGHDLKQNHDLLFLTG
jgi:hypothetical protein